MTQQIQTQQRGRVLIATLSNPPHNFLTTQMVTELDALVRRVEKDDSVGAVVLTGATPEIFISHFDVGEIAEGGDDVGKPLSPTVAAHVLRLVRGLRRIGLEKKLMAGPLRGIVNLQRMHEVFQRMQRSPAVFIAAINGRAMGGGFELALACDLRLMAKDKAVLCLPETVHGIIPGGGGTQTLTRALGESRARALILGASEITPKQALDWGLVEAVHNNDLLLEAAEDRAQHLARRSRVSVASAKQAISAASGQERGWLAERIGFLVAASTPTANAALRQYHQELKSIKPGFGGLEREFEQWRQGKRVDISQA